MGRKAVRWYAAVNVVYTTAALVLLLVFLVGFGPTVNAALAAFVGSLLIQSVGSAIGARRVTAKLPPVDRVTFGACSATGCRSSQDSLAVFFAYRSRRLSDRVPGDRPRDRPRLLQPGGGPGRDRVLLSARGDDAVLPARGGVSARGIGPAGRRDVHVSRCSCTGVCALLMAPAATVMVWVLLPAYGPSLPALYLLLPGVVAFSVTFALGGYLTGIDRPGITSGVSIVVARHERHREPDPDPAVRDRGSRYGLADLLLALIGAAHDRRGAADEGLVPGVLGPDDQATCATRPARPSRCCRACDGPASLMSGDAGP